MPKKIHMTLEEHKELGAQLARIQNELVKATTLVANAYPQKSEEVKLLRRAVADLSSIKDRLERRVCVEYPDDFSTRIYYPRSDTR